MNQKHFGNVLPLFKKSFSQISLNIDKDANTLMSMTKLQISEFDNSKEKSLRRKLFFPKTQNIVHSTLIQAKS